MSADFVIYSPTIWPDDETAVTTTCDVAAVESIDGCLHRISMTCAREGFEEPVPFEFSVPLGHLGADRLSSEIAYFESLRDVEVSFVVGLSKFSAVPDGQMMIREPGGDLVLLSLRHGGGRDLVEGESLPLDPPWWSTGDDWNSPFSEVRASHVGCAETEPIRVGGMYNVPLAVEFEADAGPGSVLDREVAYDVAAGGSTFSVYAPFAFLRKELTCGDCAPSEAAVLFLRDPDG